MTMTAEKMMNEYKSMKKELRVLEFQLGNFQGVSEDDVISSMVFGCHSDTERVQTSGTSDKTAMTALRYKEVMERENEQWFDFLWNRYRYVKEEVDFFETSVRYLPDELGNIVMDMIEKVSWDNLCEKYDVCRTTISNRKKEAMKQLNESYRLRDMQTEQFMLS